MKRIIKHFPNEMKRIFKRSSKQTQSQTKFRLTSNAFKTKMKLMSNDFQTVIFVSSSFQIRLEPGRFKRVWNANSSNWRRSIVWDFLDQKRRVDFRDFCAILEEFSMVRYQFALWPVAAKIKRLAKISRFHPSIYCIYVAATPPANGKAPWGF